MAGFDKIWIIGDETYDVVNPIRKIILEGISSRMWFELSKGYRNKLNKVKVMIPSGPRDFRMMIDMCMCFYPEVFFENEHYAAMWEKLPQRARIDFDLDNGVPEDWNSIRQEIIPIFDKLSVFSADIELVKKYKRGNDVHESNDSGPTMTLL